MAKTKPPRRRQITAAPNLPPQPQPAATPSPLTRLPSDVIAAIDAATMTGRYMIAVVRLDREKQRLELYRHIRDIPKADHELIVNLIRDNLRNA